MKREATADLVVDRERASATPALRRSVPLAAAERAATALGERTLASQQRWFLDFVTTPEAAPPALDVSAAAELVTAGPALSAFERLEIYRQAYHARLIECLADDYPVLKTALGDDGFETLARAYIARHPSQGPSLNGFGRALSAFCRVEPLDHGAFAADLAALEWAIVDAIHAPTVRGIDPETLAAVPGERWPQARLVVNPSLRVLELTYPANSFFQAVKSGAVPAIPSPAPTRVAVYRTGRSVWRMELMPGFAALVEWLASGVTLGVALERVEPLLVGADDAERAQTLGNWFRNTVSSGLFSGLGFEPPTG